MESQDELAYQLNNAIPLSQSLQIIINDIETYMLETNKNITIVHLKGIIDHVHLEEIVNVGFVPISLTLYTQYDLLDFKNNILIAHFIEKLSIDEQDWWFNDNIKNSHDNSNPNWSYHNRFIYGNLNGWKEFTRKSPLAFPLLLYFKDQLYSSNRPKTDMSIFRQVTSVMYDPESIQQIYINLDLYTVTVLTDKKIKSNAIPVTRYAAGMSKGLFYINNEENTFCGTFFYYEPESITYLAYNTVRIYRNKFQAMEELYNEFKINKTVPSPLIRSLIIKGGNYQMVKDYYDGSESLPDDMKMTINEYFHPYDDDIGLPEYEDEVASLSQRKFYIGYKSGLYGLEDIYDQDLCNIASKHGIDIIILTHMIGRHQVVTEVLDTRIRQESLSNLLYPSKFID